MPKFTKHDGTSNPYLHMRIQSNDLGAYTKNEQLIMQLFQKSLTYSALTLYMKLDPSKLYTWDDIVSRFMTQYKNNIDNALDRLELLIVGKKSSETFKQYAQRWRNLAAQVNLLVEVPEMVKLFI